MRYVPELISLCSREVARQLRDMTHEERYETLLKIPSYLLPYIKAFPLNYISWCIQEQEINLQLINWLRPEEHKLIKEIYEEDCKYGLSCTLVIYRKCPNNYCNNLTKGRMIKNGESIRYNLCEHCDKYRLQFKNKILFYREINKYKNEDEDE